MEQSGTGSNDNKGITPCSRQLQNKSFTIGCSFMSYSGPPFVCGQGKVFTFFHECCRRIQISLTLQTLILFDTHGLWYQISKKNIQSRNFTVFSLQTFTLKFISCAHQTTIDCTSAEGYPPRWVSWVWHWTIWWWGSSDAGALGNVEHSFIAIAPRLTLARYGSTR